MNKSGSKSNRDQSRGEEIANSISHGIGLMLALIATPFLIVYAVRYQNAQFIVSVCLFGATMSLVYLTSTIYHALHIGKAKRVFQVMDHSAIFLFIAGSYTPFTLGVLHGAWGWTLFGLIWGLALIGVALKICDKMSHPILSTGMYLLMGWLVLIAIHPLYTRVPMFGLLWLAAGGLAYTAGVIFYVTDGRLRYGHFIWHLFVMTGSSCHYCAVLWYAA
ncbi:MAG: hemolysin III family protein [Planctomycetota bacterium]